MKPGSQSGTCLKKNLAKKISSFQGDKSLAECMCVKPPPYWKCNKCLGNHWPSQCSFAGTDLNRTTGIQRFVLILYPKDFFPGVINVLGKFPERGEEIGVR